MSRVVHFDIAADDPERAIRFYSDVFGWTAEKWEGPMDYWLVTTGPEDQPGINGGIARRQQPTESITNTTSVSSVDEIAAKVTKAGGKILQSKKAIPGVGHFALCQDTEGNAFGIMEEDPTAQ